MQVICRTLYKQWRIADIQAVTTATTCGRQSRLLPQCRLQQFHRYRSQELTTPTVYYLCCPPMTTTYHIESLAFPLFWRDLNRALHKSIFLKGRTVGARFPFLVLHAQSLPRKSALRVIGRLILAPVYSLLS